VVDIASIAHRARHHDMRSRASRDTRATIGNA
jgi:hypothetical protein